MIIVFIGDAERTKTIAEAFRLFWSLRGMPSFVTYYYQAATEASLCASSSLGRYVDKTPPTGPGSDLEKAIISWGDEVDGFWYATFKRNTDTILADWREKLLPHYLLVHGFNQERDVGYFKDALRVRIGASAPCKEFAHVAYDEQEEDDQIVASLSSYCLNKIEGSFDERAP
jgi:hypothetical protein